MTPPPDAPRSAPLPGGFADGAFTIVAHRGLHGPGRPENSLEALRAAREVGLAVELDVTRCASGELVLFHDAALEHCPHVSGGRGRIRDLPWARLREVRFCETGAPLARLEEALEVLGGEGRAIIEVKQRAIFDRRYARESAESLARTLDAAPSWRGRALLGAFHPYVLEALRRPLEGWPRAQIIESYSEGSTLRKWAWQSVLGELPRFEKTRPQVLMAEHNLVTPALTARLAERGIALLPWLTHGRNLMRELGDDAADPRFAERVRAIAAAGSAGLITDDPLAARALL